LEEVCLKANERVSSLCEKVGRHSLLNSEKEATKWLTLARITSLKVQEKGA